MSKIDEIDSKIKNAKKALNEVKASLDALTEERRKLVEVPPEPTAPILHVVKRWEERGATYTYVLLKANGVWTITGGNTRKSFTWEELYRWIKAGYWHGPVRRLTVSYEGTPIIPSVQINF